METWMWIAIVGLVIIVLAFLFKNRTAVTEQDKRDLMNLEMEMKLEGFRSQYYDLRRIDFEGAFALHNSSKHIWYVGSSRQVYLEVMELISGKLRPYEIYEDVRNGDFFSVRAVKLEGSGYRDRYELRRALEATYAAWKKKY